MSGEDKSKSRFAELAFELMGSKIAGEFLTEAWRSASPEAKAELSKALIERVLDMVKEQDNWTVKNAIERHVNNLVEPYFHEALKHVPSLPELQADITKRVKDSFDRVIDNAIRRRLDGIVEQVKRELK